MRRYERVRWTRSALLLFSLWLCNHQIVWAAGDADQKLEERGPQEIERPWQVSFAPTVSTGTYGTDTRTTLIYAPLSVRRLFRNGDISVTVPWVTIHSTGAVRLVGDRPNRTSNSGRGSSGSSGSGSGSENVTKDKGADDDPLPSATTDMGLGDVIIRGRYYVVDEGDYVPLVAVTGRIKLPTASESRGLGTGKFDEGIGLEVSKGIGLDWLIFVDGGYTFIGKPEGTNFRDQWWYDIGLGYYVTDRWLMSVYYEEYRSIIPGLDNPRDVYVSSMYKLSAAWRITASALVGLSDGAPDFGGTIGVSYRF